ncbi:hypothetical protein FQN54_004520 [Arachnomyces sp. PD_36]|nr:hypothetical protein FQN54_004520 [Arachnomyces sp. PD_36]
MKLAGTAIALISLLSASSVSAWSISNDGNRYDGNGDQECTAADIPQDSLVTVSGLQDGEVIVFYRDQGCQSASDFIDENTTQPLPENIQAFAAVSREEDQ